MLDDDGRDLLLGCDDEHFCDMLVRCMALDVDSMRALRMLYVPWVLQRLQTVRQRSSPIFYGSFLATLRAMYGRELHTGDLFQAMQTFAYEAASPEGDVGPDAFHAAATDYYRRGGEPGVYPGWDTVAQHYTVRPGELTIVTGIASHMKTTWVQALCVNLAHEHGWRFGLYSPEQYPVGALARTLVESHAGMSLGNMPPEWFETGMKWVTAHFYPMVPPEDTSPTVQWILNIARYQVERYQISGLVLDPFNEIEHQQRGLQSETQYISEMLSALRRFGRAHNVHVWLVAHPTKLQRAQSGPYEGKYPPPTPYDISGSAHFYNKADNCLCVWRDVWADSPQIELHIQKIRYRSVGKPGMVPLTYKLGRFIDVETPQEDRNPYATRY